LDAQRRRGALSRPEDHQPCHHHYFVIPSERSESRDLLFLFACTTTALFIPPPPCHPERSAAAFSRAKSRVVKRRDERSPGF
jgi:hypothetical protein